MGVKKIDIWWFSYHSPHVRVTIVTAYVKYTHVKTSAKSIVMSPPERKETERGTVSLCKNRRLDHRYWLVVSSKK